MELLSLQQLIIESALQGTDRKPQKIASFGSNASTHGSHAPATDALALDVCVAIMTLSVSETRQQMKSYWEEHRFA